MKFRNTSTEYGAITKLFHWSMALLIIGMIALGFIMGDMEMSQQKLELYGLHKSLGATLLILVALRILWRFTSRPPALPDNMNMFQKMAAHFSHMGLYMLMMFMPLVGWGMSSAAGFPVSVFGLFTLPNITAPDPEKVKLFKQLHFLGAFAFAGLIFLHFTAALSHHFIKKDNVLRRMLPVFLGLALLVPFAANAAEPIKFTVTEGSGISFEAVQNSAPVKGKFEKFTADIAFNPEALDKSKIVVNVDMNSVAADYAEVPSTLKTPDWFSVNLFPAAAFETGSFTALGDNKFETDATLTIKDKKVPVKLAFTLHEFGDTAHVTGETVLKRTDFGIGWADTSSVKDDVKVTIEIKATKAAANAE